MTTKEEIIGMIDDMTETEIILALDFIEYLKYKKSLNDYPGA